MPCSWRRDRNRRACPRSPMPMTSVVSAMTPTNRVKVPARRRPSTLISRPGLRKEPGLLFFRRSTGHSDGVASLPPRTRGARSFTTCIECPPIHVGVALKKLAGAEARPRPPCPISGVPTHKHRPARCACALGRPPVACSDASLACAGQPRRVWTQPRWFNEARRRTHAPTGANRPQRLGGVGTRHRHPFNRGEHHEEEEPTPQLSKR